MEKLALTEGDFDTNIIERGQEYYENNMIGELYKIDSNIYSKISGYMTMIGPEEYYCSCPYYDNCKHLYALLLKIQSEAIIFDLMDNINVMDKNELINLIKKIVKNAAIKTSTILKIISNPNEDYDTSEEESLNNSE